MKKQKLKTYAPMTAIPDNVKNNSMKLYSYLLCIAGLARYPENTRMFRQKNLNLTEIQRCIGIMPKTTKLYLYDLEVNKMISYEGYNGDIGDYEFVSKRDYTEIKKLPDGTTKEVFHKVEYRKAKEKAAFKMWNSRNKEGVYYIKKPMPYTPIPEITLSKLNSIFQLDEIEMKVYIYCCIYRDVAVERNNGYFKTLTYEALRSSLGYSLTNKTCPDSKIRRSLYLLRGLGLIELEDGFIVNQKKYKVPCFKLTEVYYYVSYNSKNFEEGGVNEDEIAIKEKLRHYDESLFNFA